MSKRVIHRFTKEEDDIIIEEVKKHGDDIKLAIDILERKYGERHSRRSIIERYKGFLSQNRDKWTSDEDKLILDNYKIYGNKWSLISMFLKNRSGDQVKIRHKQLTKIKDSNPADENSNMIDVVANSNTDISDDFWISFMTDFEMDEDQLNKTFCLI